MTEPNPNSSMPAVGSLPTGKPRSAKMRDTREKGIMGMLVGSALFSVVTTFAIIYILGAETWKFFTLEEPVVERVDDLPLAGTFTQRDGSWQFELAPWQQGRVSFITPEQRAAQKEGAEPLPGQQVVVRVDDNVRLPGPGKGGVQPQSPEAAQLQKSESEKKKAQSEVVSAAAPAEGSQAEPAANEANESEQPQAKIDPDDYATFDIIAISPSVLTLAGGPDEAIESPVVARVSRRVVPLTEFFFGGEWSPLLGDQHHYGIWPLICGTFLITSIAMLVAVPLGLVTAIWLSEYAPPALRGILKPVLEVLAGIPTVVFGFFALTSITPFLRSLYSGFEIYNVTSAGIAVGILTLPIITSLSEDAFRAVPRSLREGSYGLGATKFETSLRVVFPAALSGVVAAVLLAVARAVGETMIVALAAGSRTDLTLNPTGSVQPMTGYMVQIFLGDVSNYGVEYLSSYAVASTLFVLTLGLTLIGNLVRTKYRQAYE